MQKGTATKGILLKYLGMTLIVILCAWQLTLLDSQCWEALCDLWSRGQGLGQIHYLDLYWLVEGNDQTGVSTSSTLRHADHHATRG